MKTARARLIHWRSTPTGICKRKDAGTDQRIRQYGEETFITKMAEADHPENVTCQECAALARGGR